VVSVPPDGLSRRYCRRVFRLPAWCSPRVDELTVLSHTVTAEAVIVTPRSFASIGTPGRPRGLMMAVEGSRAVDVNSKRRERTCPLVVEYTKTNRANTNTGTHPGRPTIRMSPKTIQRQMTLPPSSPGSRRARNRFVLDRGVPAVGRQSIARPHQGLRGFKVP
jgi:hypothetical protein